MINNDCHGKALDGSFHSPHIDQYHPAVDDKGIVNFFVRLSTHLMKEFPLPLFVVDCKERGPGAVLPSRNE